MACLQKHKTKKVVGLEASNSRRMMPVSIRVSLRVLLRVVRAEVLLLLSRV